MNVYFYKFRSNAKEMNVTDSSIESGRLDQIISDYRRVHEAATNEIDRKRRAVRSKCEERLWMSALWRDYQLEIVKKSFESEIKQIEREHQVTTVCICVCMMVILIMTFYIIPFMSRHAV